MDKNNFPERRYRHTITFLKAVVPPPAKILDLGIKNPFSEIMEAHGYTVTNTGGEDLDLQTAAVKNGDFDAVTAFEILEHLVSPFTLLKAIEAPQLVATVPLNLWFTKAYRSKTDMWDLHFHEFEDWQFNWLLEKAGWDIKHTEKWTSSVKQIGLRPLLRRFTPRYYAVYAGRE